MLSIFNKNPTTWGCRKGKTYLRNKSWKPECVESFNMDWRILVFYPEPEARDTIY
jgi:hypothetical protein